MPRWLAALLLGAMLVFQAGSAFAGDEGGNGPNAPAGGGGGGNHGNGNNGQHEGAEK